VIDRQDATATMHSMVAVWLIDDGEPEESGDVTRAA
jgi:hypothetical protein